jgi:hypothetical protein
MSVRTIMKSALVAAALAVVTLSGSATAAFAGVAHGEIAATEQSSDLAAAGTGARVDGETNLSFPTGTGTVSCASRDIYLAAGWYSWEQDTGFDGILIIGTARTIFLGAGWYYWKVCVGGVSAGGTTAFEDSYLRQKSTGGYAHLPRATYSESVGTYRVHYFSILRQL